MIVLWTDALIYILISVITVLFLSMRKKEHFVRPWKLVANSRTAMASLVFLAFFLVIGLLDSVHFRPSNGNSTEIISVLDYWASPLRLHQEKSYSAPFSAYAYSKELIMLSDQASQWGYRRLEYGGSHLNDVETKKTADIFAKALLGFVKGAGVIIVLFCSYHWLKQLRFLSRKPVNTVYRLCFP